MSGMRYIGMVATAGFVLALPILLFTTNIRFLASDTGYLEGGLRRHDAAENTDIALGELDYAVASIVRYFEDDAETLRILVFTGGEEMVLFSEEETIHMEDVKGLMRTIFRANEVALGFVLAYVAGAALWSGERSGRDLAKETLAAVGVGGAAGVFVGILAIVGFESAWERLHEIIFTNDFWLLDPSRDRLIQIVPGVVLAGSDVHRGGAGAGGGGGAGRDRGGLPVVHANTAGRGTRTGRGGVDRGQSGRGRAGRKRARGAGASRGRSRGGSGRAAAATAAAGAAATGAQPRLHPERQQCPAIVARGTAKLEMVRSARWPETHSVATVASDMGRRRSKESRQVGQ